jgi:hypothetical protein
MHTLHRDRLHTATSIAQPVRKPKDIQSYGNTFAINYFQNFGQRQLRYLRVGSLGQRGGRGIFKQGSRGGTNSIEKAESEEKAAGRPNDQVQDRKRRRIRPPPI